MKLQSEKARGQSSSRNSGRSISKSPSVQKLNETYYSVSAPTPYKIEESTEEKARKAQAEVDFVILEEHLRNRRRQNMLVKMQSKELGIKPVLNMDNDDISIEPNEVEPDTTTDHEGHPMK